jgi:hypothetical protein
LDGDEEMPQSSIFDRFREYELRENELQNLRAEDLVEVLPIYITENHPLFEDRILSDNLFYVNVSNPFESDEFFQNITDIQNLENIANNHVFGHGETDGFSAEIYSEPESDPELNSIYSDSEGALMSVTSIISDIDHEPIAWFYDSGDASPITSDFPSHDLWES